MKAYEEIRTIHRKVKNNEELQKLDISTHELKKIPKLCHDIRHRRLKKLILLAVRAVFPTKATGDEEKLWKEVRKSIEEYQSGV